MDDFWNPSPDTVERCDEDRPLDERHLWPQDTGKLPYDALMVWSRSGPTAMMLTGTPVIFSRYST